MEFSKFNGYEIKDKTARNLVEALRQVFESHTHPKSEIEDFAHTHNRSEIEDFAHGHNKSDITDFKVYKSEIEDFAHTHSKSEITDFAHGHDVSELSGILPVEKGGTGVNALSALLTALGINNYESNCVKIGDTIIQWGIIDNQTIPANDGVAVTVNFETWNYGANTPTVIVNPRLDSYFNLAETNLAVVSGNYFTVKLVNTYSSQMTFGAHWVAIGKRG